MTSEQIAELLGALQSIKIVLCLIAGALFASAAFHRR